VLCGRQIFVERFASDVLAPSARRTGRLDCIVHHLGLAPGGREGANLSGATGTRHRPVPPGGSGDIVDRIVGQFLSQRLGQPFAA